MHALPSLPVTGHMPPFLPASDWGGGRQVVVDPRHAPRVEPGEQTLVHMHPWATACANRGAWLHAPGHA